jgi:hypothetical protein
MTQSEILSFLIRNGTITQSGDDFQIATKTPTWTIINATPKELLKSFIKDSKIPFQIKSQNMVYNPGAESDYARKYIFNEVMVSKRFAYSDMIKATEQYYNNPKQARVPLKKYFQEGIFDQVMEQFLAGNLSTGAVTYNKVSL